MHDCRGISYLLTFYFSNFTVMSQRSTIFKQVHLNYLITISGSSLIMDHSVGRCESKQLEIYHILDVTLY